MAAPFDGTLETSLVEPGDIVTQGQVLARLDGREMRLDLSALEAEHGRARKQWEASLALDDIYESQQARLEMQRLELQIKILRDHQRNLEIRSPQSGIVVSGELRQSEGAPVTLGQNLCEVAPLSRMKAQIRIPESEIAYIRENADVEIRLDAFPREVLAARLTRIVPRAELRDEQFVFIAEAVLENPANKLRPGMNGQASLLAPRQRLGWLLFHKPLESLLMLLGW